MVEATAAGFVTTHLPLTRSSEHAHTNRGAGEGGLRAGACLAQAEDVALLIDRAGRLGASGCRSSEDEKTLARASIEMNAAPNHK